MWGRKALEIARVGIPIVARAEGRLATEQRRDVVNRERITESPPHDENITADSAAQRKLGWSVAIDELNREIGDVIVVCW
jgi:hypothetical protein